ncbi:MAG: bifunctional nuclease family protein [bacterium]|nr:bifunctional nuclease family protein [bacterium]
MEFHRVIVDKLGIDVVTHDPVIILTDVTTGKSLPLVIGIFEATSIAFALEHHKMPRPLSHDLIKETIEQLDAELVRVEIHSVIDDTYICNLVIQSSSGELIEIDARPSDAIAVALRTNTDIFISAELMERVGVSGRFTASSAQSEGSEDGQPVSHLVITPTHGPHEDQEEKENEVDEFLDNFDCSDMLGDEDENEDGSDGQEPNKDED